MANRVLDLSTFVQDTLEIKLLDGTSVHLNKPTQKIAVLLMSFQNIDSNNPELLMKSITEIVSIIFSNNISGKKFSAKWVEDNLDFSLMTLVVQEYGNWIQELTSNPN